MHYPKTLKRLLLLAASVSLALASGCQQAEEPAPVEPSPASIEPAPASVEPAPALVEPAPAPVSIAATGPSAEEAMAFVEAAEAELRELGSEGAQAAWVQANFITEDTQAIAARANEKGTTAAVRLANEAAKFNDTELDYDTRRKLDKLKTESGATCTPGCRQDQGTGTTDQRTGGRLWTRQILP